MEELDKPKVSITAIVISAVLAAVIFGGGVYAYQSNQAKKDKDALKSQITALETEKANLEKQVADSTTNTTTTTQSSTSTTTTTDETANWKTYTSASLGISFKYPSDWFVKEASSDSRIYVRNTQNDVDKETMPSNFQQIWISYSATESAVSKENNTKSGNPDGREISGSVTPSTIKAGNITINTYEYSTVGGLTLEAYWASASGKRYWATNSTEIGTVNQQNMVANLKLILSTFQFTK